MPFDGTYINKTAARLIEAKELIRTQGWCPDGEGKEGTGPHCAGAAIHRCDRLTGSNMDALQAFANAIGIKGDLRVGSQIGYWNDSPGRTIDEVYAAFDRAIALALA